jgi:hypothetical protein
MADVYSNYGAVAVLNPGTPGYEKLATQATLEAILAKLSADPATQTTLAAVQTTLDALKAIFDAGTAGVTVNGGLVTSHTFHDAATVAADGTPLTVGGGKTLLVEIWGTSVSRTVGFKGAGPEGTHWSIMGVNLGTFATATSTTGTGELWQFDVTGLVTVIMDLEAVAGGNVSVKGRLVA